MTPFYAQVAGDLRARISAGEYAVGAPIPSTSSLVERYGYSVQVIRHAVEVLMHEGVLAGHGGKAVYVKALPDDRQDDLASEVAALREDLDGLYSVIGELCSRLGYDDLRPEEHERHERHG